jgi:hypothetical protein
MIKIPEQVFELTETPGYYLTSTGVIDYNLKYIGYIYDTVQTKHKIDNYRINFNLEWGNGKLFVCHTHNQQILLFYDHYVIGKAIENQLNDFTYKNYQSCFHKIPNNIKVMWDYDLIDKQKLLYSHFLLRNMLIVDVSLLLHEYILEILRLNYTDYTVVLQEPKKLSTIKRLKNEYC